MHAWGWSSRGEVKAVAEALEPVLARGGLAPAEDGNVTSLLVSDGEGGTLLVCVSYGRGREVARELCVRTKSAARYAEVDLSNREVSASGWALGPRGTFDSDEDLDDAAGELCEEWFEGGRYRSEAIGPLVAALLKLDPDRVSSDSWRTWKPVPATGEASPGEAEKSAVAASEVASAPSAWRVFRHADGREWQIRVREARIELRIVLAGDEPVERSRGLKDPICAQREAERLVCEQLADGFSEATG
ncbi:MAG: hypothetical protein HY901_22215 [Deltaproteobacteria bacterium]|nr:hypothetical protein [Deltaproteobacteria bacterium]